jgi:predicted RNA-binding protein with PUA domain
VRALAIWIPDAPAALEVVEAERWRVERLANGVRVIVDRGTRGVVIHGGPATNVRARTAVDADAGERTAIDQAVRDISSAQAVGEGVR